MLTPPYGDLINSLRIRQISTRALRSGGSGDATDENSKRSTNTSINPSNKMELYELTLHFPPTYGTLDKEEQLTDSYTTIVDKFVSGTLCFTRKTEAPDTGGYGVFSGEVFETETKVK